MLISSHDKTDLKLCVSFDGAVLETTESIKILGVTAVDGIFKSIIFNEYQHWTFPKHNYKRVVTLSVMILDNSQREVVSQEIFSCIIFERFMPQRIP